MMKSPRKLALVFLFCILATRGFSQDLGSALKFDFFSPVSGCLGFSYERSKSEFVSLDVEAGYIGVQLGDYFEYNSFIGGYFSAGPRLYFKQDLSEFNDMRGAYFKPQFMVNYYKYSVDYYSALSYTPEEVNGYDFTANIVAVVGKQWVMMDKLVFDLWFGLGYGMEWRNWYGNHMFDIWQPYDTYQPFKFNFINPDDSPILIDAGLSFGFVF